MIRYKSKERRTQKALDLAPFHRFDFPDGTIWTEFYRSGPDYLLRFQGLADFEVSADGTRVTAYPAEGGDETTIEHLYINQVAPLAMSRQGVPAFHASVVTVPGGAVAFLGIAGMGKSTLAASFALNEAEFLTDDSLLIKEVGEQCLALPSHPSLRLWEDSLEALIDDRTRQAAAVSYSTKARLLAGEALAYRDNPQRLLAAFVLELRDVGEVTIRELAGAERHMAWVNNSFLLDVEDQLLIAQHFDWTYRISETVPTFALDYPRDYGMLPDVRDAIRRHMANL